MGFTNSPLVYKTMLSNKHNNRKYPISKITIHHAAGVMSFDELLKFVANCGRDMSSNYVLRQGKLGLVVEEKYRAWTSSNAENDHRAVTIEVGNSSFGGQWPIAPEDLNMLINWCADVCIRNNIPRLYYDGTPNGTLTLHEMFVATACPGPYIKSKLNYICQEVNKIIEANSKNIVVENPVLKEQPIYKVVTDVYGYTTASDAVNDINRKCTVEADTYYIFNETDRAVNVTVKSGVPGAWISKSSNKEPVKSVTPTLKTVAYEVIRGEWGNGSTRVNSLNKAGYIAKNVQAAVDAILAKKSIPNIPLYSNAKKTTDEIVKEVIAGKWGNGAERKKRIAAAGYDYGTIQREVNKRFK
jgi:hypothetical protein